LTSVITLVIISVMTNTEPKKYQLRETGPRRFRLFYGEAVAATISWRKWAGGHEGYQYMPWTQRRPSRVLRPTLFETLTKAGRFKVAEARRIIEEVGQ
jgi:hypothetical protein